MSKGLIALLVGLMAVALAVAVGCGGDDEATASSITKAQFIQQADEVCKESEKNIDDDFAAFEKGRESTPKPTDADYAELVEVVLTPNLEEEVAAIRALGAPEGDEDEVDALIEAREESIEVAQDDPKLTVYNNEKVFGESSKLAKEYGLDACDNR